MTQAKPLSPQKQFASFLSRFDRSIQTLARSALQVMRKRFPGAIEMVYDNYNGLVVGFSPTLRPSDAVFSIVIFPQKVAMCFIQGAKLRDPKRILRGEGNQTRSILIDSAKVFDQPAVRDFMKQAMGISGKPMSDSKNHQFIIRAISAKQRPRKPEVIISPASRRGETTTPGRASRRIRRSR